jgi:hypothetical protein
MNRHCRTPGGTQISLTQTAFYRQLFRATISKVKSPTAHHPPIGDHIDKVVYQIIDITTTSKIFLPAAKIAASKLSSIILHIHQPIEALARILEIESLQEKVLFSEPAQCISDGSCRQISPIYNIFLGQKAT